MLAKYLKPQVDLAALILRLGLAALFIVHGILKVVQQHPLSDLLSLEGWHLVGWVELICGVALLVGLLSRVAALGIIGDQVGAILLVTGKYALQGPKFDKEGANFRLVGPEYNLAIIAMSLCVIVLGSGLLSLDHILWNWCCRRKARSETPPLPSQDTP